MRQVPAEVEGYLGARLVTSVASSRIADTLGLEDLALIVDTACSSSFVALHLTVRTLRKEEHFIALADGVTVIAAPLHFVEFSRQHRPSPDGRYRAFAGGVDGARFAEGTGLILIERLGRQRGADPDGGPTVGPRPPAVAARGDVVVRHQRDARPGGACRGPGGVRLGQRRGGRARGQRTGAPPRG
ncbi:beta-ketoacyl synthase N-terminal-like domain-containing protein [Streptomyces sp. 900116325]